MAEQVQGQRLDQRRAEGFDEVQRERPAAILGVVEQTQRGVKAVGMNEGDSLVVEQGGPKRDARIDRIQRRTRAPALERKPGRQKSRPRLEVPRRGRALITAEFVNGLALADRMEQRIKP